jgi:hypothetical protein
MATPTTETFNVTLPTHPLRRLGAICTLGLGSLAATAPAHAVVVEWDYSGQFTGVTGTEMSTLPPGIGAGTAFTVRLLFDTQATLAAKIADSDGTGALYRFSAASVQMFISAGPVVDLAWGNSDPTTRILVRDDDLFGGVNVDGITFGSTGLAQNGDTDQMVLINRGPDTSVLAMNFSNPSLPAVPPAGLAGMANSTFQICNSTAANLNSCDRLQIDGVVTAISAVPEPGSAWLLLAGLGLVGSWKRRDQ